jgi:thiol-disulfide isomerase/thioredoxin
VRLPKQARKPLRPAHLRGPEGLAEVAAPRVLSRLKTVDRPSRGSKQLALPRAHGIVSDRRVRGTGTARAPLIAVSRACLLLAAVLIAIGAIVWATPALAETPADAAADAECIEAGSCPVDLSDLLGETEAAQPPTAPAPTAAAAPARAQLVFFWGIGCPHCEEAKPLLAALAREFPELEVEQVEVRRDPKGSERFVGTMRELGAGAVGIPTFVIGRDYVIGFAPETTESELRELVQRSLRGEAAPVRDRSVVLPFVGRIDPNAISLPAFTVLVGLIDGINPCAMWVLLVLLGILMHVKSRARLLLFGGTFVVVSGVV